VLTDQGLAPALAGLARRARARVSLELRLRDRRDPAGESTAYYAGSEALQSVTKHTDAARACLLGIHAGARLIIEGSAAGQGGARVRGRTDRVKGVGGCLEARSPPGGGTTVRAEMPCG